MELSRIRLCNVRHDGDVAEGILLAFLDIKGDEEGIPFPRQRGIDVQNLKINVATRLVEIRQKLTIERDAVTDESVPTNQHAKKPCLLCFKDAAQAALGIAAVADERNSLNLSDARFVDFEYQINTVVGAFNDLWRHGNVYAAPVDIHFGDRGNITLRLGGAINAAWLRLNNRQKVRITHLIVAFNVDPVDRWTLHHRDGQSVAAWGDINTGKEPRGADVLDRGVKLPCGHCLTAADSRKRQDCSVFNAQVSVDRHVGKREALR